jgi:hypothetical protein
VGFADRRCGVAKGKHDEFEIVKRAFELRKKTPSLSIALHKDTISKQLMARTNLFVQLDGAVLREVVGFVASRAVQSLWFERDVLHEPRAFAAPR